MYNPRGESSLMYNLFSEHSRKSRHHGQTGSLFYYLTIKCDLTEHLLGNT